MSRSALAGWIERLSSFSPEEIELGLDRVSEVYRRMGSPRSATVLTVGGTNGKGSTVAYLVSLLTEAGYCVGAYTSPHLHVYNERVRIGERLASDEELVAAFERVESARGSTPLTYFEFGTLAALAVFEAADVEVAVLEVGLGGRLDAVNAVDAEAAIVTNVSLDHCDWLGNSIPEIAFEKAGIFRGGRPAVFADRQGAPDTLVKQAGVVGAELTLAGRDYDWNADGQSWSWQGRSTRLDDLPHPALAGDFQLANAAGALALLESAGLNRALEPSVVERALAGVSVPARMQRLRTDREWFFDVAHNPAAARVLAQTLQSIQDDDAQTVAIIGMLDDKDVDAVVLHLCPVVDVWIAMTADNARAVPAAELARRVSNLSDKPCLIAGTPSEAVAYASEMSPEHGFILVTGSFFTVGPAQRALGLYSPSA